MKPIELMTVFKKILLTTLPLAFVWSCSSDAPSQEPESCRGDRCDELDKPDSEVPDSPCDGVIVDQSGRNNKKIAGRLNDPLSNLVFKTGEDCPSNYQDIMAKLRKTDAEGCAGERDGIVTRAVSETAQAADMPTDYRLVTTRKCNSRDSHELIFSLFGVRAGAGSLPANVEVMAFDKEEGVFNYYEMDGRGEINFFGNSNDMLQGSGPRVQGQVTKRKCAGCHNAGGLVMKELDTPWVHWEGHMNTPGAKELVEAHADLGTKATGLEFEGLVKRGNKAWNDTRLATLRTKVGLKETLRPLFCEVEVNIDTGSGRQSPVIGGEGGDEIGSISFDSLLDPHLKRSGGISIEYADYDAAIKANGQKLSGIPGQPNAIDTVFDYVFIERSNVDNVYVDKLMDAETGIIDEEFVKDVLLVDFTRPIFSNDRCGLLEFAPVLSSDNFTPEKIRAGFVANLAGQTSGSPGAELRNNLLTEGGHDEAVKVFTDACSALESADLVNNALQVTSLNRDIASELGVFESDEIMPHDDLDIDVESGTRLLPNDCSVGLRFVAITPTAPEPEPVPVPTVDCAHEICEEGVKLDPACNDACVAIICAPDVDPFCCNDSWDDKCVARVEENCGQTCP